MRMRAIVLSVAFLIHSFAHADETLIDAGIDAAWRGDSAGAEAALRAGVAVCAEPVWCATGMNVLAALAHAGGREAEAESLFRLAMSRLDDRRPEHVGAMADASNGVAGILADRGEWDEAERLASRARKLWERSSDPETPDLARALMTLAEIRFAAGDVSETRKLLGRAARLAERPGASPVLRAAVQARRGALWLALGHYGEAEPALERALELAEDLGGPEHPALVPLSRILADCYRLRHRLREAAATYERALRIAEKTYGTDLLSLLPVLAGLAEVAERQEDDARAVSLHARALSLVEKSLDDSDPRRFQYLCQLAAFHARRGDTGRAEHLFHETLDTVDRRRYPALHAAALDGLRGVYLATGRRAEAARIDRKLPRAAATREDEPASLGIASYGDARASLTEP